MGLSAPHFIYNFTSTSQLTSSISRLPHMTKITGILARMRVRFIASIILHGVVSTAISQNTGNSVLPQCDFNDPDGVFCANWAFDTSSNTITFDIRAVTTGWVALGISTNPSGHRLTQIQSLVGSLTRPMRPLWLIRHHLFSPNLIVTPHKM